MTRIITKIDILFYFGWPAISTYTIIVLYDLQAFFLYYFLKLYNYICCLVNAEIKYILLSLSWHAIRIATESIKTAYVGISNSVCVFTFYVDEETLV